MERCFATRDNLSWIFTRKLPGMTKSHTPRNALEDIATSIRTLVLYLETKEVAGRRLTATEIETVAGKLQIHVEELLAASKSLRNEKLD
jgi:hypothetical protein